MNTLGLTTLLFFILPFSIIEPSQMSMVAEKLYFDQAEVSNEQWQAFELAIIEKGINPENYRVNDVFNNKPWNTTYFSHESYRAYPVVGVTKLGATEFCKWRNTNSKTKGNHRLPTKEEFQQAIKEGEQSVKWFKKKIKAEKNNKKTYNLFEKNEVPKMIAPAHSFLPNKFGIYNLVGNLSEMVQEEGIVVGGSWKDKDELKWSSATQPFNGPTNWIGFRCVCEVE